MSDTIEADVRFAVVPEWVIFHEDLSHAAVRVYAVLQRHANGDGEAWPSLSRIGRLARCSPDTARRAIRDLVDAGALHREPRHEDGRQTSNRYVLFATPPEMRGGGGTHARGGVAPVQGGRVAPVQGEERKPEEREPVKTLSGEPDEEDQGSPAMTHAEAFDALAHACGLDADGVRATGGALIGRNAKIIRDMGVTAEEVQARADAYRRAHPDWDLTPAALVKWWSTLEPAPGTNGRGVCECGQPLNRHDPVAHDVMLS